MEFCNCNKRDYKFSHSPDGHLIHQLCGLPLACEFSYLDEPESYEGPPIEHPANQVHIDYLVCGRHLEKAVDNVHSRTMP